MNSINAPNNLTELRKVISDLQSGRCDVKLGNRTIGVFKGMVSSPRQSAVYSISELANSFGVNPSTLTRLAKSLGYSGFASFQQVFRQHVANSGHFYSDSPTPLNEKSSASHQELATIDSVAKDASSNMMAMMNNINTTTLEKAVHHLAESPRILIHGLRQCYPLASAFSYSLGAVRNDVYVMSHADHGIAHSLAKLEADDMFIALSSAPYTRTTLAACKLAKRRRINVLTITDSHASPLAAEADYTFIAPGNGDHLGSTNAASLVLIEALTLLTAQHLGDRADKTLRQRLELIQELQEEF